MDELDNIDDFDNSTGYEYDHNTDSIIIDDLDDNTNNIIINGDIIDKLDIDKFTNTLYDKLSETNLNEYSLNELKDHLYDLKKEKKRLKWELDEFIKAHWEDVDITEVYFKETISKNLVWEILTDLPVPQELENSINDQKDLKITFVKDFSKEALETTLGTIYKIIFYSTNDTGKAFLDNQKEYLTYTTGLFKPQLIPTNLEEWTLFLTNWISGYRPYNLSSPLDKLYNSDWLMLLNKSGFLWDINSNIVLPDFATLFATIPFLEKKIKTKIHTVCRNTNPDARILLNAEKKILEEKYFIVSDKIAEINWEIKYYKRYVDTDKPDIDKYTRYDYNLMNVYKDLMQDAKMDQSFIDYFIKHYKKTSDKSLDIDDLNGYNRFW